MVGGSAAEFSSRTSYDIIGAQEEKAHGVDSVFAYKYTKVHVITCTRILRVPGWSPGGYRCLCLEENLVPRISWGISSPPERVNPFPMF